MKSKIIVITILVVLGYTSQLFAHAPWIETNPRGIKGKPQEIQIFFGEFSEHDISPASKWFSDLKNFTLVLITPGKKQITLSSAPAGNCYTAEFTPTEDGVYTIVMHHLVKDVYAKMKLDYHSSATVMVGDFPAAGQELFNPNIISLYSDSAFAARVDKKVQLKAIYDGKPASKQEMEVVAPNGWAKKLHTDEKGQLLFIPPWPGKYMAEYSYADKTPGEHNGKKYEETRKIATYIIIVK